MSRLVTLFQNQVVRASDHTFGPGEEVIAISSVPQANSSGNIYNSIRVDIEYSALSPAGGGAYFIGALLEAKDAAGNWAPLSYQFSPIRSDANALKRILIVQPDLDTFSLGIDDVVYPTDKEVARISRQQGIVPETEFRLCISFKDNDPNGASPFVEVTVSATAELYNV